MESNAGNPEVDWYFEKPGRWQEAFGRLRTIALGAGWRRS